MKDYYKILEISRDANKDEIKKSFRRLAKQYHPDRNQNDELAIKKFQEINEAYKVLNKEELKIEYDKKLYNFNKNNKNDDYSNNGSNNSKKKSSETQNKSDNIENLNKYFESFFGFDANSSNINKDKLRKSKNPMDTSDIFESFFNIKKK